MTHNLLAKRRLCSWRPDREAKSLATYYVRSCQRMYGLASVCRVLPAYVRSCQRIGCRLACITA